MDKDLVLFGGPKERLEIAAEHFSNVNFEMITFNEFYILNLDPTRVVAIWTELGPNIDLKVLNSFPNIRHIFTSTTGVDHINVGLIEARGMRLITLKNLPDTLKMITSTAELTWCLVLALWRNLLRNTLNESASSIMNQRESFSNFQLSGRNLGLIGFGRIGKKVAEYGKCFGMHVYAYDPYIPISEINDVGVIFLPQLIQMLEICDVVILCASKIPGTTPIVDVEQTRYLKNGAIVVNTARGGLWNESAIADSLIKGKIGGVGVDVYQFEELGAADYMDSPFLKIDYLKHNIIRTPHIGGASFDALELVTRGMAKEVVKQLSRPKND